MRGTPENPSVNSDALCSLLSSDRNISEHKGPGRQVSTTTSLSKQGVGFD